MAFYFALLNVSAKKEEKQHKHRHRRHSIASVESPLLDYRLLPRPQLMGEDDKPSGGMRKSESNYSTGRKEERRRTPDNRKSKSREPSFKDTEGSGALLDSQREKRKKEQVKIKTRKSSQRLKKSFSTLQPPPNSPAVIGNISTEQGPSKLLEPRRFQRHFFQRRRQSPPDSTTSGSRRSSKGSQNSTPRRDTPSSSSCSRRESEEPVHNAISSLVHASHRLASIHITRPQDRFNHFKKVTFNGSPLVIRNNFLGERAVLVQKGSTVLRRSSTAAQPLAGCGVDWWGVCAENGLGEGENTANSAIEESSKLTRLRPSLLRRRSTSDKGRVAFVVRNDGFLSDDDKDRKNGNNVCLLKRAGTTKG